MAKYHLSKKFRCYDDCKISGCPGHEMTFDFQSTSDAYTFKVDGQSQGYWDRSRLVTMLQLLKELEPARVEISSLLRDGLLGEEE